jgi:hypothetical protein
VPGLSRLSDDVVGNTDLAHELAITRSSRSPICLRQQSSDLLGKKPDVLLQMISRARIDAVGCVAYESLNISGIVVQRF